VHITRFDDIPDVARRLDVSQGVALDHHEVSKLANFYGTEFLLYAERAGTVDGGGLQHRCRWYAGIGQSQ
jgi:hypothetical protein